MESAEEQNVSENIDTTQSTDNNIQNGGPPLVFLREDSFFKNRKPHYSEFFKHEEMYHSIADVIDPTHITGLQRVNGLWRVYVDNLISKAKLITEGVTIRGHSLQILQTNPFRLDGEDTTRIRVQDIPLSADDGVITRVLVLKGLDVISTRREKLRIAGKLTNIDTGDRLVTVKTSTLKVPLTRFMHFGKWKAKVVHKNQNKTSSSTKCIKCFELGHTIAACENDWRCMICKQTGHKKGDCTINTISVDGSAGKDVSTQETPDDTGSQTTTEQHDGSNGARDNTDIRPPNPTGSRPVRVPSRHRSAEKKQKSASEGSKGQPRLDHFMQNGKATPRRDRSESVKRSPPVPPEKLRDTTKKQRHHDDSD